MINFTDITGLASSTLAIIALTVRLSGMARLKRIQLATTSGIVAVAVLIPVDGLPLAAYVRGWIGDLSITTLLLLLLMISRDLSKPDSGNIIARKNGLFVLVAMGAATLYPMALGVGLFDPYQLGYGNNWFMGGLLILALSTYWLRLPFVPLALSLAMITWSINWYESGNLWDYLLDPWLAFYSICVLLRDSVQILLRMRRIDL